MQTLHLEVETEFVNEKVANSFAYNSTVSIRRYCSKIILAALTKTAGIVTKLVLVLSVGLMVCCLGNTSVIVCRIQLLSLQQLC